MEYVSVTPRETEIQKKKKKEKEYFLLTEHTWTKEEELSLAKARSMLTLLFR